MSADSLTQDQAEALLDACVRAFNAGVQERTFEKFLELFTEDAVLEFEGINDWGPFEGRDAIAARIERDPPDDQIRVTRRRVWADRIVAEFRWNDIPEARGGDLLLAVRDGRIARLCIAFGGPSTRWR